MVEFLLLFSLGFLAAALIALVLAPVIHRRIVTLTERRMQASVPLSAAEVRAGRDMARAAFAAENAKLVVEIREKGDKLASANARNARLANDLVSMRAEKIEVENRLQAKEEELRSFETRFNVSEDRATTLQGLLNASNRLAEARGKEIAERDDRINRLMQEIEERKIDLATRDAEVESFIAQIEALREERRALRDEVKKAEKASRDLGIRLEAEETRNRNLDDKLAKAIASLSDREDALERRTGEVTRLLATNKTLSSEIKELKRDVRTAQSAAKSAEKHRLSAAARPANKAPLTTRADAVAPLSPVAAQAVHTDTQQMPSSEEELALVDRLRARQAALSERIVKARTNRHDDALRSEIAEIAAAMVQLTAYREGPGSQVHKALSSARKNGDSQRPSLADRAQQALSDAEG